MESIQVKDEEAGLAFSVTPASGGELSSFQVRRDGVWVELLHRADRFEAPGKAWRGRAPWLFPAVGRSLHQGRAGRWALDGQVYHMPLHGFVMDRPWQALASEAGTAACTTASDEETRRMFPFDFQLIAAYRLLPQGLSARLEVAAAASNHASMPFSVGNHLSLALPFGPGKTQACLVSSPARESLLLTPKGLLSGEAVPSPCLQAALLTEEPALDMVLGDFPGPCWAEVKDGSSFGLRVSLREVAFAGVPKSSAEDFHFVLYSDGKTFFCPEPWYGAPNSLNSGKGLVRLGPGEKFLWEMELSLALPAS